MSEVKSKLIVHEQKSHASSLAHLHQSDSNHEEPKRKASLRNINDISFGFDEDHSLLLAGNGTKRDYAGITEGQGGELFNFQLQDKDLTLDSGSSILIVDDDSFNIVAIQSLLQQFNLKSDYCNDGKEAIEMVKKRSKSDDPMYKLILMDYSMPDCDGPQATYAIREYLNEGSALEP